MIPTRNGFAIELPSSRVKNGRSITIESADPSLRPAEVNKLVPEDVIASHRHIEPAANELSLTSVLYALSDETRLRIVEQLAGGDEVACGCFNLAAPKSSQSHHFRVLLASGVIARRREGTALLNRLRRADLDARFPGLLDAVLNGRRPPKSATGRTRGQPPAGA